MCGNFQCLLATAGPPLDKTLTDGFLTTTLQDSPSGVHNVLYTVHKHVGAHKHLEAKDGRCYTETVIPL